VLSTVLTALTLLACAGLKIVTDIMAASAAQLANAAVKGGDPRELIRLNARVEDWSTFGEVLAWAVAALVVGGSIFVTVGMYRQAFQPLSSLASSMKRFTEGEREVRAKTSGGVELATAADAFNEMADTITGQHELMLDFLEGATHELGDPLHVMRMALQEFAPDKPFPAERLARQRVAAVTSELDRLGRWSKSCTTRAMSSGGDSTCSRVGTISGRSCSR
jgi:signal transduction histidine kinase